MSSRIYDWSVFADQNHFLTEESNFEAPTTGCLHHPKFQGQVQKEAGEVCAGKDPGGCICNTNCQGCGCTCGYSMATRSMERSNKNCFEKCVIKGDNELVEVDEDDDLEF